MFNTFGNKVIIKSTPETETKGLAGKTGEIYGHTTPTVTDVEVIGQTKKDFALNVYFDDLKESFWFDESLIEELDNGAGTEMTLDGIDKKWTKDSNGNWIEQNLSENSEKKWWKFWKKYITTRQQCVKIIAVKVHIRAVLARLKIVTV